MHGVTAVPSGRKWLLRRRCSLRQRFTSNICFCTFCRQLWVESLARPHTLHTTFSAVILAVYGFLIGRGWYQKLLAPAKGTYGQAAASVPTGQVSRSKADEFDW